MSNLTIKQRELEFDKLCIYPIKGKSLFYIAVYIANGKSLQVKPIDSSFNNEQIAYCLQLSYGIISFNSFINIETMSILSSDVEVNEYKLIGTNSDELVNALEQLGLPYFFGFIRQLLLRDKLRSKTLEKEMILYLTVNKEELDCMNFKKFKDSLLGLKEITGERENTEDELKIWKLIKIERKKLEEFRIEKEKELE